MARITVRKRKPHVFNRPASFEVLSGGHILAIIQQNIDRSDYYSYSLGLKSGWNTSPMRGVSFELCKVDTVRRVKVALDEEPKP